MQKYHFKINLQHDGSDVMFVLKLTWKKKPSVNKNIVQYYVQQKTIRLQTR